MTPRPLSPAPPSPLPPGEPLLLLHGFTGAPASWDELAALVPPTTPVVRETLCGHGPPELDEAGDFDAELDRLARRLRGLEGVHLVGYSLGARVGLGLLARHPERFSRATLAGLHPGLATDAERDERRHSDEHWAQLAEREGISAFVAAWARQPVLAPAHPLSSAALARQRSIRLAHRPEGLARALRVLGLGRMPDLRPALARMAIPLRLVVGAADEKFRALAESIRSLNPRADLRLVEHAGHDVVLEAAPALLHAISTPPPATRAADPPPHPPTREEHP